MTLIVIFINVALRTSQQ